MFIKYIYNTFTLNRATKYFTATQRYELLSIKGFYIFPQLLPFSIVLFTRSISIATFSKKKKKKEKLSNDLPHKDLTFFSICIHRILWPKVHFYFLSQLATDRKPSDRGDPFRIEMKFRSFTQTQDIEISCNIRLATCGGRIYGGNYTNVTLRETHSYKG